MAGARDAKSRIEIGGGEAHWLAFWLVALGIARQQVPPLTAFSGSQPQMARVIAKKRPLFKQLLKKLDSAT